MHNIDIYVDDVLDVWTLQGIPGIVGSLLVGFFADQGGLFIDQVDSTGRLLLAQFIGVLVAFSWSAFWTGILIKLIHFLTKADVTSHHEDIGLDRTQIGSNAYDLDEHGRAHASAFGSDDQEELRYKINFYIYIYITYN